VRDIPCHTGIEKEEVSRISVATKLSRCDPYAAETDKTQLLFNLDIEVVVPIHFLSAFLDRIPVNHRI
jgi:hypothetical protein